MTELHDIVTSLLDKDGSCRDLNFEAPTWAGAGRLLASLENAFGEVSGTDQDGKFLGPEFRQDALAAAQKRGYAHLLFSQGAGLIRNLQVFISCEDDGSPFVELTFFPEDVRHTAALRCEFIAWAQQLQSQLGAPRCYARYENAAWRFGDIGAESGVFLVSDDIAHDA